MQSYNQPVIIIGVNSIASRGFRVVCRVFVGVASVASRLVKYDCPAPTLKGLKTQKVCCWNDFLQHFGNLGLQC